MARWNPVVFRRCACTAGACPTDIRFEPQGRTSAAVHVLVHQRDHGPVQAAVTLEPAGLRGLPFLLLGFAALLLATLDTRVR
ncbi:MAG TPA: hypothetical protein VFX28_23385 [Methylomirabilota bacterium]|nr:hypothetical protein [Methylomirabilota bacterium]